MVDTVTPNYGFIKPEISGSPDTWGNKLNQNFDALDSRLKEVAQLSIPVTGGIVTGQIRSAVDPVAPEDLVRKNYVDGIVGSSGAAIGGIVNEIIALWLPKGVIMMWAGTIATIPSGWALCDGSVQNGVPTPNLTSRFIMGASAGVAPGTLGGSNTHDHVIAGTALSVAQMPAHNHGVTDPGHNHTITDPGHTHTYTSVLGVGGFMPYPENPGGPAQSNTGSIKTGITLSNGTTGITINNNGSGATHTHGCEPSSSIPPYYALAYIIRVH
jgi:hypothetical protein